MKFRYSEISKGGAYANVAEQKHQGKLQFFIGGGRSTKSGQSSRAGAYVERMFKRVSAVIYLRRAMASAHENGCDTHFASA